MSLAHGHFRLRLGVPNRGAIQTSHDRNTISSFPCPASMHQNHVPPPLPFPPVFTPSIHRTSVPLCSRRDTRRDNLIITLCGVDELPQAAAGGTLFSLGLCEQRSILGFRRCIYPSGRKFNNVDTHTIENMCRTPSTPHLC